MGNSWGSCPSNIDDLVERSGFSHSFFPLVSMVTATVRDFPQEKSQRGKKDKKGKKGLGKGFKGLWVFNMFFCGAWLASVQVGS